MSEFLLGARAIAKHLEELGLIPENDPNGEDKVYYWARKKIIPTGRLGKQLVSTPTKLQQIANKLIS